VSEGRSLISRNPQVQSGAYCIRDTEITVKAIKDMLKSGYSEAYIMRNYGIKRDEVIVAQDFRRRNR